MLKFLVLYVIFTEFCSKVIKVKFLYYNICETLLTIVLLLCCCCFLCCFSLLIIYFFYYLCCFSLCIKFLDYLFFLCGLFNTQVLRCFQLHLIFFFSATLCLYAIMITTILILKIYRRSPMVYAPLLSPMRLK